MTSIPWAHFKATSAVTDSIRSEKMERTEVLTLEEISMPRAAGYLDMIDEFEAAGEGYPYNNIALARRDFAAFVRELEDEKHGIGLPPGIVPQTTYVLVRDGERVLGEFRFRPTVPPPFRTNNGHIGYNVRPSERRKGYATRGLAMLLSKARELCMEGVMLPVVGENAGSVRAIEKNGGRLERRMAGPRSGRVVSWYWVRV